ncbi:molybdopterin-dependent oxidoreductase [Sulfitobacter sp. DFL-23]|uniref:Oxidoreductase n=1 Tax=Pseudosulfitobacter pseudonitzschiae TaxID=1402135 RepID=A0A221K694_9RHOB|nr:molybdopterin-dependent oxidoreductase [Sulfitobacter sp. DFL-23]ASM74518.1 oxidoreductase [Pseudosulfitobacter pseudonitzschiae]
MLTQTTLVFAGLVVAGATAVTAQEHMALHVSGQISGGSVTLDQDALSGLPTVELVTSTVVTDGQHSFTGFLMRDLLDQLGAKGETVTAIALNDYVVEIPMADFYDFDVIAAHSMDGIPLDRDDKGPLWIVYPRDDHEALQDIRYDYRWVWQLYQLEVR